MTLKERMLIALSGGRPDAYTWAPNLDHWMYVNTANKTLPEDLVGLSRNDLVRKIGGVLWARSAAFSMKYDETVTRETQQDQPGTIRYLYHTPVGTVSTFNEQSSDPTGTWFMTELMLKEGKDFPVVRYMIEHTVYTPTYDTFVKDEAAVGDDGVTLFQFLPSCPYQEYMIRLAGWENGAYLMADYPNEVAALLETLELKALEGMRIIADSPATVCEVNDNMDGRLTSPGAFRKYNLPFYQKAAEILHAKGKLYGSHFDGAVGTLLEMLPDTGLDFIEALTPPPMGNCTIADCTRILKGKVAVHGGIAASMTLPTVSREDYIRHVEEALRGAGDGTAFVLGMGDNVPPDADFDRIRQTADIAANYKE